MSRWGMVAKEHAGAGSGCCVAHIVIAVQQAPAISKQRVGGGELLGRFLQGQYNVGQYRAVRCSAV